MTFLRNFVVIGAIVFACYFGLRDLSGPSPATTTAETLDSETLSAAEKFTRDWFDRHGDMPRDQAARQFMQDADAWAVAYRAQHGLSPLTFRERDALRDKLCARVRCGG
jgi:hypothetical protein